VHRHLDCPPARRVGDELRGAFSADADFLAGIHRVAQVLLEAGIDIGLFPNDLMQELSALNKEWSDTRRKPKVLPPPNDTSPIANASYYKPGTSMEDNLDLYVRPPKDAADGFFTVEDGKKNVLAYGRTIEEIAVEWRKIDADKVIAEKLVRQTHGGSNRLLLFN